MIIQCNIGLCSNICVVAYFAFYTILLLREGLNQVATEWQMKNFHVSCAEQCGLIIWTLILLITSKELRKDAVLPARTWMTEKGPWELAQKAPKGLLIIMIWSPTLQSWEVCAGCRWVISFHLAMCAQLVPGRMCATNRAPCADWGTDVVRLDPHVKKRMLVLTYT